MEDGGIALRTFRGGDPGGGPLLALERLAYGKALGRGARTGRCTQASESEEQAGQGPEHERVQYPLRAARVKIAADMQPGFLIG
jgi:hypothetical protein